MLSQLSTTTDSTGKVTATIQLPADADLEMELHAFNSADARAKSTLRAVQLQPIPFGNYSDIDMLVGHRFIAPGTSLLYYTAKVEFDDGTVRSGAMRLDMESGVVQKLTHGDIETIQSLAVSPNGKYLALSYEEDAKRGVLLVTLDSGKEHRFKPSDHGTDSIPDPIHGNYDGTQRVTQLREIRFSPDSQRLRWLDIHELSRICADKLYLRWRLNQMHSVDLSLPSPESTLIQEFRIGPVHKECPEFLNTNERLVDYVACGDTVYTRALEGRIWRLKDGELKQLTGNNALQLQQIDGPSGCEVIYLQAGVLYRIAFDGSDKFTPELLADYASDPLEWDYNPANTTVLSFLAGGPLTLATEGAGIVNLSQTPSGGDLSGLWTTDDKTIAIFRGPLLSTADELFITTNFPGSPKTRRISQYPPSGSLFTSRSVVAVQFLSDQSGLVFVQGVAPNNAITRPFVVKFADVPDKEEDGEPYEMLGFDEVVGAFKVPGQTTDQISVGASKYVALIGDPSVVDTVELNVVDIVSNKTYRFFEFDGVDIPAPLWSDDANWLVIQKQTKDSGLRIFNVDGFISEID